MTQVAAKQEASERAVVMGMPIDIDPLDALLQVIRITAGEVEYCTNQVWSLEPDAAIVRDVEETMREAHGHHAESYEERKQSSTMSLHVWIKARQDAMDRLARYCKMAIDCGIAERQVQLAENLGSSIGRLISAVLGDMALTPAQAERAPEVVRHHMLQLTQGEA
jgi:hypothetical protein